MNDTSSQNSIPPLRMPSPTLRMPSGQPTQRMNVPDDEQHSQGEGREHITIGTVLGGQFALRQVLSEQTGEAALFLCQREEQTFVSKVYHMNKRPKKELFEALSKLRHPSVLQPTAEGEHMGRYYEILPYFSEGDLEKAAPLTAKQLKNVVVPAINEGLHALHEQGIIHRDIKPSNLFFADGRKRVVIGDFGISSLVNHNQSVRYTTGSRTLGYSAPETAQGFISKESDFYSLGITLLHLATGFDPFSGMTDQQILRITLMDKLEIPLSVDPSIAHLIRGLTHKERINRWGYNEIKRWCSGESVSVADARTQPANVRPYVFQGRSIDDMKELSLALADQWEEAGKHLYRGLISDHLKQFGQDLASAVMDCEEETDKDMAVFRLILTLNPEAPLCWKGEVFFDLQALGSAMASEPTQIQPGYMEMLQKGAWLQYISKGHYDDALKTEAARIQELFRTESDIAYFRMMYLLTQNDEWCLDSHSFFTPEAFVEYLARHSSESETMAKRSLQDPKFWAWLISLRYEEQVCAWRNIPIFKTGENHSP